MTQTIQRHDLRAFFQPYAEQGHKSKERVHLHCCIASEVGDRKNEWAHFKAGYVAEVRDDAVMKYNSSCPNLDWIAFDTINRITVRSWPSGEFLRELQVLDGVTS